MQVLFSTDIRAWICECMHWNPLLVGALLAMFVSTVVFFHVNVRLIQGILHRHGNTNLGHVPRFVVAAVFDNIVV